MKKTLCLLVTLVVMLSCAFSVSAMGSVTYSGNSGEFIFAPGSDYSPTDLFSDFKDVMPGDSITQSISVKNNANKKIKVEIFMRSLGASEESRDFLSNLNLKVSKSEDNEMAYMFDASADVAGDLSDWVSLGVIYSGGEVNLDLILTVPTSLSNEYQDAIGYLAWEFMVNELPLSPGDPRPPQTGDNSLTVILVTVMAVSLIAIIVLLILSRRKKDE